MFTPCGEDPQGRCNLLRRATSLARHAYLSGMRATRPAVFRVTNRRLEPVLLAGKVLPVLGAAWTLLLSRRKPWRRRSLLLREFLCTVLFDHARGGQYTHYAALDTETCRQACTTSDRRRTPAIGIRGAPSASPASASYSSIWERSMGFNRTRRRGASARRGWGRAPAAENLAPL